MHSYSFATGRTVRIAIALLATTLTGSYLWYCGRVALAEHYGMKETGPEIRRAIALQPRNAEYHYRLAALSLTDDIDTAVSELQTAVSLDRSESRYWVLLALAYQVQGRITEQDQALRAALAANPTDADAIWDSANLYLVSGHLDEALKLFRKVVESQPARIQNSLRVCWRATGNDALRVLREVVPPKRPDIQIAFIDLLTGAGQLDQASAVWQSVVAEHQPFDATLLFPFMDVLLASERSAQAIEVWKFLVANSPSLARGFQEKNLVHNGDFEEDIINGGFSWRFRKVPEVGIELDPTKFHSANRSVLFTFRGGPARDTGLYQQVPVAPSTCYLFTGMMSADNLRGAVGPSFTIVEDATGSPEYHSEPIVGTTGWREVMLNFKTGPETQLVSIQVGVPAATHIQGNLSIDDVFLAPVAPSECAAQAPVLQGGRQ